MARPIDVREALLNQDHPEFSTKNRAYKESRLTFQACILELQAICKHVFSPKTPKKSDECIVCECTWENHEKPMELLRKAQMYRQLIKDLP